MTKIGFYFLLGFVLQTCLDAQPVSQAVPLDTNAAAASVAPTIVERSSDSRI
jgi:hypothetical protein